MKSIDIYVNEKLILNNQSTLSGNINLEQKIKLALNFDDSVFKDSSNIYKKCLKHIMSELTYFFKIKNADELTIITTETSWNRKIKEFPSCEKYKYLFTIDDDQFIKLVQKYDGKLYYYTDDDLQLGIVYDHKTPLIFFGDGANRKSTYKQYWFTNSKLLY